MRTQLYTTVVGTVELDIFHNPETWIGNSRALYDNYPS